MIYYFYLPWNLSSTKLIFFRWQYLTYEFLRTLMSYRTKFFSCTFSRWAVFLLSVIFTFFFFSSSSIVVPHCEQIPIVVGTKPTFINRILALKNLLSEHGHRERKKHCLFFFYAGKNLNARTWRLRSTKIFN